MRLRFESTVPYRPHYTLQAFKQFMSNVHEQVYMANHDKIRDLNILPPVYTFREIS